MPDAAKQVLVEIKTTADTAAVAQESAALEELRTKLADANAELKTWNDLNRKGIADEGGPLDQRIKASAEEVENLTAKLREAEQAQKDLGAAGEKAGEATAAAADKAGVSLNALGFAQGLIIAHWRRIITWAGEAGTAIGKAIFRPTDWGALQKDIEKTDEKLRKMVDAITKIHEEYDKWVDKQFEAEHSLDAQLEKLKQIEASEDRTAKRQADIRKAEHEYNAEEIKLAEDKGEISHTEAEERRQQLEFERSSAENNANQDKNIRKITDAKKEQAIIEAEGKKMVGKLEDQNARVEASHLIARAEEKEKLLSEPHDAALKEKSEWDAQRAHLRDLGIDVPDELKGEEKRLNDNLAAADAKLKPAQQDRARLQRTFPGVTGNWQAEEEKADELRRQSMTGLEKGAKQYDAAQTRINEAQADAARDEVAGGFNDAKQDLRNQDALGKAKQKDQEAVLKKEESGAHDSVGGDKAQATELKAKLQDLVKEQKGTIQTIIDGLKDSKNPDAKGEITELQRAMAKLAHPDEDNLKKVAEVLAKYAAAKNGHELELLKHANDINTQTATMIGMFKQVIATQKQHEAELKNIQTQLHQSTSS